MFKKFLLIAAVACAMPLVSCSDDDNNSNEPEVPVNSADIDYNSDNAASWGNYMYQVSALLKKDATTLYDAWQTSYEGGVAYSEIFKKHNNNQYSSAESCIQQIIDGCVVIASEVGTAKIGDPYNLYVSGQTTQALYAVESWYSWHSRDDYTNNIYSIQNSYYGSTDGSINPNSISALVAEINPELDAEVKTAIKNAANAIQAIPQPFRNHINSREAVAAMSACAELVDVMDIKLKSAVTGLTGRDAQLQAIVDSYVDVVVLPTYKVLKEKNEALHQAVTNFKNSPSNAAFEAACNAWLVAREPWEKSEAFLFGPVDALGLDPNMDSWPLDQDAIVQILNSGNYNDLNWSDSDSDDAIEAAQSVRGFHTLEFLLFKNGNPRTINN